MKVIVREWEKRLLDEHVAAHEARLIVVYGRRRVGKTWLVKHHLSTKGLFFYTAGQADNEKPASQRTQLDSFDRDLVSCFRPKIKPARSTSWSDAINSLVACVETAKKKPIVLFFDELPWLAGDSDLDGVLEHAWDKRLSDMPNVTLVVCGSAATWMRDYRNRRKGTGSRGTELKLEPLSLRETQIYLAEKKNAQMDHEQVLDIYTTLGGVPKYLDAVQRGQSATQNIGSILFDKGGAFADEFRRVYASMFVGHRHHEKIVRSLAAQKPWKGRTLQELTKMTKLEAERLDQCLAELTDASFVLEETLYGERDKVFRLIDEYSLFYLRWIDGKQSTRVGGSADWWSTLDTGPRNNWAGYVFEAVCRKHQRQIAAKLGIPPGQYTVGTFRHQGEEGAQIDLLFDREDKAITLCELKFVKEPFRIDSRYSKELERKRRVFRRRTKTKKQLFLALVTTHGLAASKYNHLIDNVVTMDALFEF